MHPQLTRCYDLAIKYSWHHPFFLIPLGHCEWHEGFAPQIRTMAVSTQVREGKPEIHLFINTDWVRGVPDEEVFGVLCHEMLHPMLHHMARMGSRDKDTWNQATDMAINQSLISSGIKLPSYALKPPPDHSEAAAEELYDLLDSKQIPQSSNYDPTRATSGCAQSQGDPTAAPGDQDGDQEGSGEGQDAQGEENGSGASDGQGQSDDRAWGEMLAQSQAQGRGTGTAKALAKLFKPAPVKTKWDRLLRREATRAATRGGADCQTWQRINRRSEEIILPGLISKKPSIAVLIDTSGSVSNAMLRAAVSNVIKAARVSGVRFFLALHDGVCYYPPGDDIKTGWIQPTTTTESISALCTHRGGTDPKPGFDKIADVKSRFDVLIYLTDGEVGMYPDKPMNCRRVIVGLLGNRSSWRAQVPPTWIETPIELEITAED